MQNLIQTLKQTLVLSLFVSLFSVAFPAAAETATDAHPDHSQQSTQEWPGVYNGFTPCEDCNGIKTSLALNGNGTYILMTQYVGKSPRDFVEKGKFVWHDDTKTIAMTSRDGKNTHQYALDGNHLMQLDSSGKRISDKHALRRNDLSKPEHQSH
jgi:uncharacterized lipoprotein NlpE involved in copper resistance